MTTHSLDLAYYKTVYPLREKQSNTAVTLDLFTPSACKCGWPAQVFEYPEETRIGGWCMCRAEVMPIAHGRDFAEAREDWENQLSEFSAQGKGR